MMVEAYLRRGQRRVQQLFLRPGIRSTATVLAYWSSGFLISAGGLAGMPQPLAMGLICAQTGWRALIMCIGAMLGYPFFWGQAGNQGIVWSASGGLLALLLGKRQETREQPLMIPAIACLLTAVTGLSFLLLLKERASLPVYGLQILATLGSGILFTQFSRCRDAVTDWLISGVSVLALARISLGPFLGLGHLAAGLMAVGAAFPAAALAGLALDVSRLTRVPMTAVMCLAYFLRMIPFDRKWQRCAAPAAAYLMVSMACGIRDPSPLPGMILGGAFGAVLPPKPQIAHRRGDTGVAQVRLELSAEVFSSAQQLILEMKPPPIDRAALLERARNQACSGCTMRRTCRQSREFSLELLENPRKRTAENRAAWFRNCVVPGSSCVSCRRTGSGRRNTGQRWPSSIST